MSTQLFFVRIIIFCHEAMTMNKTKEEKEEN